jgi:exopolysaccharide biosynthesis polyprenyl glycosylphosphotransferase
LVFLAKRVEDSQVLFVGRIGRGSGKAALVELTPMDRCRLMAKPPENDPEGPTHSMPPEEARLLLVGARRQLRRLAQSLDDGPCSGLPIVGFVDLSGRGRQLVVHPRSTPVPILGRIDRLAELVDRCGATDLIVALAGRPANRLRPQIARLRGDALRVHWLAEEATPRLDNGKRTAPRCAQASLPWSLRIGRLSKRMLDVFGAAVGLALLSPLFLIVASLILITSGRPIFYTQDRVGQGGRIFRILKFRSMRRDAEGETGPIWATFHDTRCTKIGDWLRHTNIDELPQLFNVLAGDMSLVGPRPERPIFVEQFTDAVPDYEFRHAVPAGMTGWAQVHGWRGRTSLRKRVQYDLDYIRRWSFGLDVKILFMTIQHVVHGKTKWDGGSASVRRSRLR